MAGTYFLGLIALSAVIYFNDEVKADCGGLIEDFTGMIRSPSIPARFPAIFKNCTWKIKTPPNYHIVLHFRDFHLKENECANVYVTIRSKMEDGQVRDHGKFCGVERPADIRSESNVLLVEFKSNSYNRVAGFSADFYSEFKMLVEETSGVITSPLYPLDYPPNQRCTWEIRMPPNNLVKLYFKHFDLEEHNSYGRSCDKDFVILKSKLRQKIYKEHGRFCKSAESLNIVSESNTLLIEFRSDDNNQRSGFEIEYLKVSTECGGLFNTSEGFIATPQYPARYPPDVNCTWNIQAPLNHNIKLEFTEIRTEDYSGCRRDNVTVQSKMANGDLSGHGVFCGSELPPAIISESNILLIQLKSNSELQYKGFLANFSSEGCGGLLEGSKGNISTPFFPYPYPINKTCEWTILVPPQHKVKLHFLEFEIEGGDGCPNDFLLIQSSSKNGEIHEFGKFCGASRPASITSRNTLLLKFVSDLSIQKTGFKAEFIIEKLTVHESSNSLTTFTTPEYVSISSSVVDQFDDTTAELLESTKEEYTLTDEFVSTMSPVMTLTSYVPVQTDSIREIQQKDAEILILRNETKSLSEALKILTEKFSSMEERQKILFENYDNMLKIGRLLTPKNTYLKEGGKNISSLSERQLFNDCGKFVFFLRRMLDSEL